MEGLGICAFLSHRVKTALVFHKVRSGRRLPHRIPQKQKEKRKEGAFQYLHATAWWDLAEISEPGDLGLGETADAGRWDDGALSLGDGLGAFTLLKTPHNYRKTETHKEGETAGGKGEFSFSVLQPTFDGTLLLLPVLKC